MDGNLLKSLDLKLYIAVSYRISAFTQIQVKVQVIATKIHHAIKKATISADRSAQLEVAKNKLQSAN